MWANELSFIFIQINMLIQRKNSLKLNPRKNNTVKQANSIAQNNGLLPLHFAMTVLRAMTKAKPGTPCRHLLAELTNMSIFDSSMSRPTAPKLLMASTKKMVSVQRELALENSVVIRRLSIVTMPLCR